MKRPDSRLGGSDKPVLTATNSSHFFIAHNILIEGHTNRQAHRQTDRQTERQTYEQTDARTLHTVHATPRHVSFVLDDNVGFIDDETISRAITQSTEQWYIIGYIRYCR